MANKEQTDQIRKLEENFYEYGLPNDEDMSFFGQMVNMVTPARRTVLREPQTTFSDPTYAPDPMTGELRGEVERSVTPGLYGEPEFGMSYMPIARAPGKALDYLSSFITEPETRSAALEGIQSLPEAITRRMRVSEEAAQGGMSEVYDPSTGDVVSSGDMLLAAPLLGAPGTALSIAQMGDKGSSALFGNFGGTRGRFGPEAEQIIARLEAQGITDPAQQWEAQANTNLPFRAFRDDLGGNIKYEIPTTNAKLAPINGKELDEEFLDDALFSLGSNNPSEIYDRRGAFYLEPSSLGGDRPDNITLPSAKSFRFSGETKANAYGLTFRNTRVGDKTPDYAIRKAEENGIVIPTTLQPVPLPTIDQVLDFPELFEEYPVLREMRVTDVPGIFNIGLSGAYDDKNNILMLASQPNTPEGRQTLASVALHEIQHGLQTIEGFPKGGSSSAYYPKGYEEKRNELRKDDKKLKEKIQTRMEEWDERLFGRDLEADPELSLTDRSNVQLIDNYIRHATEEQTEKEGSFFRGHYLKLKNNSIQELDQKLQLGPNLLPMFIENLDDFVQESAKIKERQSKVNEMEREGFKSYAGLPGEVEARNVQLRFEGDKKKTAAEYRDMPPTQTRDNQGLFFPLEESDLYKKAEGGEISNMSERKAGLADLIYKKHFSSGPLSRMQPQSFRRGGPALGGGPINRPRFNNFKEEEQYVNPAVSSYVNPAVSSYVNPAVSSYVNPAVSSYVDPAVSSYVDPAISSYVNPAVSSYVDPAISSYVDPAISSYVDPAISSYVDPAISSYVNQLPEPIAQAIASEASGVQYTDEARFLPNQNEPIGSLGIKTSGSFMGPGDDFEDRQRAGTGIIQQQVQNNQQPVGGRTFDAEPTPETAAETLINQTNTVVADPVVADPVVADPVVVDNTELNVQPDGTILPGSNVDVVTNGTPIDEVLPAGNSFGLPDPDPSTLPSLDSYDPNEVEYVRGLLGHMGSQYDDRQLLEILNNQFGDGRTVSSDTMDLLFFRPEGEIGILQALDSSEFGTYSDYLNRIQAEQEAAAAAAANPVVADPVVADPVTQGTPIDEVLPAGNSFGLPDPDPSTLPSLDSYDPNEVEYIRGLLGHMGSQYDDRQLLEILNNQFGDGKTVSSDTMDLLFFRPEGEIGILQALDSSEFGTYSDYLNRIQAEQEAAAAAASETAFVSYLNGLFEQFGVDTNTWPEGNSIGSLQGPNGPIDANGDGIYSPDELIAAGLTEEMGFNPDLFKTPTDDGEAAAAAAADPVVADPVVADPVVADPVVADPVVADPVVADPVTQGTPVDQQLPPGGEVSNPAVLIPGEGLPADYNYSEDPRFHLRPFGEGQSGQLPLDFYQSEAFRNYLTTEMPMYSDTGMYMTSDGKFGYSGSGGLGAAYDSWLSTLEPTSAPDPDPIYVAPTDPVAPVDPIYVAPTDPVAPVDPIYVAPTDPVAPVDPIYVAPTDPVDPVDPIYVAPTDPVDPVDPVGPIFVDNPMPDAPEPEDVKYLSGVQPGFDVSEYVNKATTPIAGYQSSQDIRPVQMLYPGDEDQPGMYRGSVYTPTPTYTMPRLNLSGVTTSGTRGAGSTAATMAQNVAAANAAGAMVTSGIGGAYSGNVESATTWVGTVTELPAGSFGAGQNEAYSCPSGYVIAMDKGSLYCSRVGDERWGPERVDINLVKRASGGPVEKSGINSLLDTDLFEASGPGLVSQRKRSYTYPSGTQMTETTAKGRFMFGDK
jgi:hypothetical protein